MSYPGKQAWSKLLRLPCNSELITQNLELSYQRALLFHFQGPYR
jgi:hypothetical protein